MKMTVQRTKRLSRQIIEQSKAFGADLAGIANVADIKRSPSHRVSQKMPAFDGVGTLSVEGRKRGIVQWPEGARSAIVVAIAHPPESPELDWWVSGAAPGNTAGNRLLMSVVEKLADYLEQALDIRSFMLPYHIEHGAVYMKDSAVLAGLGCIGKNNLLITPPYGPRQRLRAMLIETDLPSTGPTDFDPCLDCPMPCRKTCPQQAFSNRMYAVEEYGMDELPGRSGVYNRFQCNRQMDIDIANAEAIGFEGQTAMGKRVKYCRKCEMACPAGTAG